MILHIDPVNGFVVVIGCLVGYLVYRKSLVSPGVDRQSSGGDLAGGIAAALATILILAFLLGIGDGKSGAHNGEHKPTPMSSEEAVRSSPGAVNESTTQERP